MASSKFTPENRASILARLELGVSYRDAAAAAGIRPETARSWLTRGRKQGSGDYAEFAQAVEQARQSRDTAPAMSSEEFREHLEAAVRGGSVQAMKLWSDLHADDGKPADARALLGLDRK